MCSFGLVPYLFVGFVWFGVLWIVIVDLLRVAVNCVLITFRFDLAILNFVT
jgi:hypothetical protein